MASYLDFMNFTDFQLCRLPQVSAASGNPTLAYIKGNYGGLTARTLSGGVNYILAIPSIITNTGTAGTSIEISNNTLSGTLLFHGQKLTGASTFNPKTVVFSGTSLPKDDSTGQITNMMSALKTVYVGTDIPNQTTISILINTATGQLATLGSSIMSNQMGAGGGVSTITNATNTICGSAHGGTGSTAPASNLCGVNSTLSGSVTGSGPWNWTCNSTGGGSSVNCVQYSNLVNGACTGLSANATYYGGATTYSLTNAPTGTSLVANGVTTPVANTCQFKCSSGRVLIGGICLYNSVTMNGRTYYFVPVSNTYSFAPNQASGLCSGAGGWRSVSSGGWSGQGAWYGGFNTSGPSDPFYSCHPAPNATYLAAIPVDGTVFVWCEMNGGAMWTGNHSRNTTSTMYNNGSWTGNEIWSGNFMYPGTTQGYVLCTP